MRERNDGSGEANILQNRFTAYLLVGIRRTRAHYLRSHNQRQNTELPLEAQGVTVSDILPDLPPLSQIENQSLYQALMGLNQRDLSILLKRALDGKTFAEVAAELGLGIKSVSAIYYRTVEKMKRGLM